MVEMGPGIFLAAVKYEATRGQEVAARRTRPLPTTPAAAFYIPDDSPGALGIGMWQPRAAHDMEVRSAKRRVRNNLLNCFFSLENIGIWTKIIIKEWHLFVITLKQ